METQMEFFERMAGTYTQLTGMAPDDASDVGIRMRALAVELARLQETLDTLEPQLFPATSTGVHLERHAQARGLRRKGAVAAVGKLRFYRSQPAQEDIPLPQGLVCATAGDPVVRFVTAEAGVLPAGETEAEVRAEAQDGGVSGNAAAGAVKVMLTPAAGISGVTNPVPFTGGSAQEEDDALRQRLLESYRTVSNGTNRAFYRQMALEREGVTSVNVLPRKRGVGTVDLVVTNCGAPPAPTVCQSLQRDLQAAKEINVDVAVYAAEPTPVDLAVTAQVEAGADREETRVRLEQKLRDWMARRPVGDPLRRAALYPLLMEEGLVNLTIQRPSEDRWLREDQVATLGALNLICEEAQS